MKDFYEGQRIAVTGGAGFVGVQLVRELLRAGAEVFVVDNFSRGKNKLSGAEYTVGNAANPHVCNYIFRGKYVRGERVDVVFNLAASVAGVLYNMGHHHEMFHTNVDLQTVPLMVAEKLGVETFVQVSSVCVYAPYANHPCVEDDIGYMPHEANAGYAWAKRMGERAVRWGDAPRAVIVRPSNVFGPYDYFDDKAHVIPALIKRALDPGDVLDVYGPKDTVREFIYSRDVALGMMAAGAKGEDKTAYNIGTDSITMVTMEELVMHIKDLTGTEKTIVWHEDVGGGDPKRWSDCTLASDVLGWNSTVGLVDGLKETINWYARSLSNGE